LIARHETTYADWIAYLEALPPDERMRHAPNLPGVLALTHAADGWRLLIQPSSRAYTARAGEMLRYPGRRARISQDWLQLPVSGLTLEDAHGYVEWLASSGRVPGARLCDEYEWERAARGADDRELPHGDALEPDDANVLDTYGHDPHTYGPDEVG